MKRVLGLLAILVVCAFAQWSAPQVGSFAVATLRDDGIEKKLRERFKANGSPVFLMGNPGAGLQQGDLIRFSDKAVFVDADVWQTLATEGALRALKVAPVVRVKAGADPSAWLARSKLVPNTREKRLYEFGASLLKVLEASVGQLPDGQKLFLSFEGGQMVLTAPASFMDRLRSGGNDAATAPRLPPHGRPKWTAKPPADSMSVKSRFEWTAWAVDDSGGPTYNYRYRLDGQIPPGLAWDAQRHQLEGIVASKGSWNLVFRVQDGSGAYDSLPWKLVVTDFAPTKNPTDKDADPVLSGIELPWDTLIESRWHHWNLDDQVSRWEKLGVRLDSVQGEAAEVAWKGRKLSVRPLREGVAVLKFNFVRRGEPVVLVRTCPVKRYPLPVFLSRNGGASALEGSTRVYRPVARDAYGGPVLIEVDYPLDAPFEWNGTELRVSPNAPGSWSAKFTARDTLDHVVEQWVTFTSEARLVSRWEIGTRYVAGSNPWTITTEFGRGRFTLFTPDPSRLINFSDPVRQDWPYVLLGANLLGAESIRHGHAFSIDLGGTLRLPDAAVLTGGIAGHIQGRYDCRPVLPWVFEGEFLGWVQQAIVATDTARLRNTISAKNDGQSLDTLTNRYGKVLGQVLSDAFDSHNAVFLTRMEGWLQIPYRAGIGFGIWRQDLPVTMSMYQRVSTGIRWTPTGRFGSIEATLRGGWGPGLAGSAVWWDLRWSSGILP